MFGKQNSKYFLIIIIFSPWYYYLALANSFFILPLFLSLLMMYGMLKIKDKDDFYGKPLFLIGSVGGIYTYSLSIICIPLFIILVNHYFKNNMGSKLIKFIFLLSLPLIFIIFIFKSAFLNILRNDVSVFSDPSFINSVNQYQGHAENDGLKNLSRLSQNKYLFSVQYLTSKYLSQIMPDTFFTFKYNLLKYSFNPPIFAAFLIPFLYGIYLISKSKDARILFITSTIFSLPSVLSNNAVSINKLLLFSPVVFLTIFKGLNQMLNYKSQKLINLFLKIMIVLFIFQFLYTIIDLSYFEQKRIFNYFRGNESMEININD